MVSYFSMSSRISLSICQRFFGGDTTTPASPSSGVGIFVRSHIRATLLEGFDSMTGAGVARARGAVIVGTAGVPSAVSRDTDTCRQKASSPSFRSFHWSVMAEEDISLVVEKNDCQTFPVDALHSPAHHCIHNAVVSPSGAPPGRRVVPMAKGWPCQR